MSRIKRLIIQNVVPGLFGNLKWQHLSPAQLTRDSFLRDIKSCDKDGGVFFRLQVMHRRY